MMNSVKKIADSRYFNLLIFAFMFVLPFFVYRELYSQNLLLAGGDGYGTASNLVFLKHSLVQGEFPLWNKYLSNGIPFAGDISNHAFYIIAILFSWLPEKLYLYTFYSFHISLGAFFTYLYLKEIGCSKLSSLCLGFIYLLSIHMGGYRKGHLMIITTIVYLPVILYFIEKYIKTYKIKWLIFSSFAMTLQFYNAFVQDVMYTDIIVFIYLLAICIHKRMKIKKILVHGMLWLFTYLGLIAMQLIPTLEMLKEYGKTGSSGMAYEMFTTYSIHFVKLLQMLFPYIYGDNILQSFGISVSSEMDIELFLGHFVLVLVIFGIVRHFRDFRVKLSAFIMAGTFLFATQAHIPLLSKVLFHIPLIGSMRCSARILFVFIFFALVICGVTLSRLQERKDVKALCKFAGIFTAAVILVLIIATIAILIVEGANGFPSDQMKSIYHYFNKAFIKDTLLLTLAVVMIFLLYKGSSRLSDLRYKYAFSAFCLIVMLVSIIETYPFTTQSSPATLDALQLKDAASQQLAKDIGNYKIWDAFPSIDGGHTSIISQSTNMAKGLSAINAYISINNPRIYRLFSQEPTAEMNFSGLLTGSLKASQNLRCQNDLLSMLGVKYIIDTFNLIGEDGSIVSIKGIGKQVLKENQIIVPDMNGELYVYSKEIKITPNTLYKISFEGQFHNSEKDMYYVDFYGGELYDKPEQQASLTLTEAQKEYSAYINSGDSTVSDVVYVRFVGLPNSEGTIRNFTVSKVDTQNIKNVYVPYYTDEKTKIYINTNAKDVLYTPKTVESITSAVNIYTNVFDYSLVETSYIENFKNMDLTNADTKIKVMEFKNNRIRAKVSSIAASFVNFSQNYYPGWKAYVNGKQVPVYMVNGLIQGIEVPAGDSVIEFKFCPTSIYIGGVISLITLFIVIFIFIIERKKLRTAP